MDRGLRRTTGVLLALGLCAVVGCQSVPRDNTETVAEIVGIKPSELPAYGPQAILRRANAGDAQCQAYAAWILSAGIGLSVNYTEAFRYTSLSAAQGHGVGLYRLALQHELGRGCVADAARAKELRRKALSRVQVLAEEGNPLGLCCLSEYYRRGIIVTRDLAKAYDCLVRAVAARSEVTPLAHERLGSLCGGYPELKRSRRESARWHRLAAAQDHSYGLVNLALCYREGEGGVRRDIGRAITLLQRAADMGNPSGINTLGAVLDDRSARGDSERKLRLYYRAVELGNMTGAYNIGLMYLEGDYLKRDPVEAYAWFALARGCYQGRGDPGGTIGDRATRMMRQLARKQLSAEQVVRAERLASELMSLPPPWRRNLSG